MNSDPDPNRSGYTRDGRYIGGADWGRQMESRSGDGCLGSALSVLGIITLPFWLPALASTCSFKPANEDTYDHEEDTPIEKTKEIEKDSTENKTSLLHLENNKTLILFPKVALDREKVINPQSLAL